MNTKLQVEIDEFSFLEIPIEADNINFILHEVDRINSIVEQHYRQKDEEEKKGKLIHARFLRRAILISFFAVGILYGLAIADYYPQVMRFFFH